MMEKKEESNSNEPKSVMQVFVDDSNLHSLQVRPPIAQYLNNIWRRKHFILAEAKSTALKAGRNTFLGHLWVVLNPLLQVALYAFVFGVILKTSRGMENFLGFLILGVIFFGFLSRGLSSGSGLIQSSRGMISSFSFPKASLAISLALRQMIDNLGPALVAIVLALAFQIGAPLSWTIFLVVPLYVLIHIFNLGAILIIARATAFIPDLKSIVNLVTRGLFFVSGIFYSVETFATEPVLQKVMVANPVYQFLTAVRESVIDGDAPSQNTWLYISAWSFGLLLVGMTYFWRVEERYNGV